MTGLKLYADGRIEPYELSQERENYIALQKSIDCDCIDIVHAVNLEDPYCMVVDDEFLLKERPHLNLVASYLYGALEHGQPICGDVIIMKDKHTPDGIETVGLNEDDLNKLLAYLYSDTTYNNVIGTAIKLAPLIGEE